MPTDPADTIQGEVLPRLRSVARTLESAAEAEASIPSETATHLAIILRVAIGWTVDPEGMAKNAAMR